MHSQLFHPANNEDGYVSVICHRERYLKELLAMGWFETADEALAKRKSDTEEIIRQLLSGIGDAPTKDPLDVFCERIQDEIAKSPETEETPMSIAGLSKSQRKKLRLNK